MQTIHYLPLLAPFLAAVSGAALAEPLSFEAAIERATRDAPSIRAGVSGVEASRDAAVAAGRLPDPSLNLGMGSGHRTGTDIR